MRPVRIGRGQIHRFDRHATGGQLGCSGVRAQLGRGSHLQRSPPNCVFQVDCPAHSQVPKTSTQGNTKERQIFSHSRGMPGPQDVRQISAFPYGPVRSSSPVN